MFIRTLKYFTPDQVQHGCSSGSFHALSYERTPSPNLSTSAFSAHPVRSGLKQQHQLAAVVLPGLPLNLLQHEFTPSRHYPSVSKQSSDNISYARAIWDGSDPITSRSVLCSDSSITQPAFWRNKVQKGSAWAASQGHKESHLMLWDTTAGRNGGTSPKKCLKRKPSLKQNIRICTYSTHSLGVMH